MPAHIPSVRAGLRAVVLAAALAGVVACASPIMLSVSPTRPGLVAPPSTDTVEAAPCAEPATVVVRYYPSSPTVSVVGWDADQAGYGLRALIRRDGALVRDHQLYVSTYFFVDWRAFARADWHAFTGAMELARPLRFTGLFRDVHSCDGDSGCSPYETLRARIPDAFLRASRDSVVVKVHGRDGSESIITLRRDVIDGYLETVASVSAALRKNSRASDFVATRRRVHCVRVEPPLLRR